MTGGRHIKVNHLKTYTKDLMRIKGSPFVYLPKAYQKPSPEKVMARTSKGYCADLRANSGRNKGNMRTFQGQKRLNKTNENKPRTDLGQAEDKKGLPQPRRESAILSHCGHASTR